MIMIRQALIIVLFLAPLVDGRRGSGSTGPTFVDDTFRYPYGWGLDGHDSPIVPEPKQDVSKVKEVSKRRVIKKTQMKHIGRFGITVDPEHPHWKDIEEMMDGLE